MHDSLTSDNIVMCNRHHGIRLTISIARMHSKNVFRFVCGGFCLLFVHTYICGCWFWWHFAANTIEPQQTQEALFRRCRHRDFVWMCLSEFIWLMNRILLLYYFVWFCRSLGIAWYRLGVIVENHFGMCLWDSPEHFVSVLVGVCL